jgi:hypothetical protein
VVKKLEFGRFFLFWIVQPYWYLLAMSNKFENFIYFIKNEGFEKRLVSFLQKKSGFQNLALFSFFNFPLFHSLLCHNE